MEADVIQSQLEGLYRRMYQACTQSAFVGTLFTNRKMTEQALVLVGELETLVEESEKLRTLEMKERGEGQSEEQMM